MTGRLEHGSNADRLTNSPLRTLAMKQRHHIGLTAADTQPQDESQQQQPWQTGNQGNDRVANTPDEQYQGKARPFREMSGKPRH